MGAQNKVIAGDYEGCIVDGVFDEFYIVLGWNNTENDRRNIKLYNTQKNITIELNIP